MIKLPSNVVAFAEATGAQDLMTKWVDYFNHYRAENMNMNVSYDNTVSFAEKNEKLHQEIQKVVASQVGQNTMFTEAVWRSLPQYRDMSFAVIGSMVDAILPLTVEQSFGRFAEVKTAGFGDSFTFDIAPNDMLVVTKASNGKRHAFAQRQYNGVANVVAENRMITVEEDLYRILAGKRNLAEYAMKITRAMETAISLDIFNAINGTYGSLPTQFKEASFAQDTFMTLAQRIQTYNNGATVSAFGTKTALSKVIPSNEYFKMQLGAEYVNTGYLGRFMGVDLFETPQIAVSNSSTYAMALDDTRIYLLSSGAQKLVKVCIEGDMLSYTDTTYANANLVQKQTIQKRWAAALISSSHFGIIDIS